MPGLSLEVLNLRRLLSSKSAVCTALRPAADLLVWIDDNLAYETALTSAVRKRLGLIKTVQGSFVDAVATVPGKHLIRVRVISKTAGYDQTREVQADFTPGTIVPTRLVPANEGVGPVPFTVIPLWWRLPK